MPRLLFDSDREDVLRGRVPDAHMVALYADVITEDSLRYWGGRLMVIDRGLGDPFGKATAMDVETGALRVNQVTSRFDEWHSEGRKFITVYANRSTMPEVISTMSKRHGWWKWYATLDGTMRINDHPNAMVQFAGAETVGFHADATVVWNEGYRR